MFSRKYIYSSSNSVWLYKNWSLSKIVYLECCHFTLFLSMLSYLGTPKFLGHGILYIWYYYFFEDIFILSWDTENITLSYHHQNFSFLCSILAQLYKANLRSSAFVSTLSAGYCLMWYLSWVEHVSFIGYFSCPSKMVAEYSFFKINSHYTTSATICFVCAWIQPWEHMPRLLLPLLLREVLGDSGTHTLP